jgi:hypothetical protein
MQAILADRVVDCTGDADVAFLAGAKCIRTPKKEAMGMTTVLNCSGVKTDEFKKYTESNPATYQVNYQFFSSPMIITGAKINSEIKQADRVITVMNNSLLSCNLFAEQIYFSRNFLTRYRKLPSI